MLLTDLDLGRSYRSNKNNMVKDFYNPVLSCAKSYKRAVGYFTISSLINASSGLSNLIENGGRVEIIASPKLSEDDINTIKLGYQMKEDVILDAMIREFNNIMSDDIKQKLNYIATLISDNRLDIKIALMEDYGAYHEKFGIVEDIMGNKIMFTGSMNETDSGQYTNFESFVVFKSWDNYQKDFVKDYEENFFDLWENKTDKLNVYPFPDALKKKVLEYRTNSYVKENVDIDSDEIDMVFEKDFPKVPTWFEPRGYQEDAISSWLNNDGRGLLSMATGTGKTLTGLYGLTKLYEKCKKIAFIIVCPYQHLVEQWVEDVRKFNINPVICYSKYHDWKNKVYRKVKLFNNGTIDTFTLVVTNATFATDEMQNFLKEVNGDLMVLVDEAHNAGTSTMKNCLDEKFKYRLGLSATPRRFRDEENTDFIFNFFGGEVYSFDLGRAIEEGYLTRYYYYPHVVSLTEEEQEEYDNLSLKIAQNIKEENGKTIINDFAKALLIKRARLVAGATNKLELLRDLIKDYTNKYNILIYCGATKTIDEDGQEDRQIKKVCKIIWNEFEIKNRKFTAEESADERMETIDMFNNKSIQAIVAIKCLDEGVNIPSIQHAFIMASNTDPKEFIQRRGRVLRTYPGKDYAYIHDFVTIPANYSSGSSLVESELKRVYEFNTLAENNDSGLDFINDLADKYEIDIEKIKDANEKYKIGGIEDED